MTAISTGPPAIAPLRSPDSRRKWRLLVWALIALLVYGVGTAIHAAPAVRDCRSKTLGPAGDGTSGGVWLAWAFQENGGLPFQEHTDLTAAPAGEMFWHPEWYTQTLLYTPIWALSHVTNPVCSYNIVTQSGLAMSGMAMFALAAWLTRNGAVSVLVGYAYAFSPFALHKAAGHAAYVHQWWFPLLFLAMLVAATRPSTRRAIPIGLLVGASGYFDGYYLLFSWLTFAAFWGILVIREWRRRRRGEHGDPARLLKCGLTAGTIALVLLIPLLLAYRSGQASIEDGVGRPTSDLDAYSAEPSDYVFPARGNPLFGDLLGGWRDGRLGGSNYSEATLFVGWTTLLLLVPAAIYVRHARRQRARALTSGDDHPTEPDRDGVDPTQADRDRAVLATSPLLLTAAVLAFVSGPATWVLLGSSVPGPSRVINAFAPYWRVYSRLFIPVHAALLAVAAIGATYVLHRLQARRRQIAALSVLAVLVVAENLTSQPFRYAWFDYGAAPDGYRWIASQDDVEIMLDHPLRPTATDPNAEFATYQPVHGKATVNPKSRPNETNLVSSNLVGLGDPQTIPLLRAMGVDLVAVHPDLVDTVLPDPTPAGLRLERTFTFEEQARVSMTADQARRARSRSGWYNMSIYRVEPGEVAHVALLPRSGFSGYEMFGWYSGQWVDRPAASFEVWADDTIDPASEVMAEMTLHSFNTEREVTISQDGRTLWQGQIGEAEQTIRFRAMPGQLTMTTDRPPELIADIVPDSDDFRRVSVFVSGLDAEPLQADR